MSKVLETSILTECSNSIEYLYELVCKADTNIYYWKWFIIALHNCTQNLMAAALSSTHGLHAMTGKCATKVYDAIVNDKPLPDEKLDYFCTLYEKIKSDLMLSTVFSKKFQPVGNENKSIEDLNNIRNSFIHYLPHTHVNIVIDQLLIISIDTMNIINFLAIESGNVLWYTYDIDQNKIQNGIKNILNTLHVMKSNLPLGQQVSLN